MRGLALLIGEAVMAGNAAYLAGRYGRSQAAWLILGLLFGPFAVAVFLWLTRNDALVPREGSSRGTAP